MSNGQETTANFYESMDSELYLKPIAIAVGFLNDSYAVVVQNLTGETLTIFIFLQFTSSKFSASNCLAK